MKYLLLLVLISACLATGCHGFKVEGRVRGCQGPDNKNVMAEVVLEGGIHRGFVRSDGKFTIHNVPKGSYVATVSWKLNNK